MITLVFTLLLSTHDTILALPFSLYSTFVIEQKHGFNKTVCYTTMSLSFNQVNLIYSFHLFTIDIVLVFPRQDHGSWNTTIVWNADSCWRYVYHTSVRR